MLEKLLIYPGKSDQGIFTYVLDAEMGHLEKTASEYNPEIAAYIHQAKPIPGKTQILLTALGAGEYWGCFLEGTPVLLSNGWEKPIEDIEEGDEVLTHTSSKNRVISPMCRYYQGDVYTLVLRSWGADIICTDEHPIYTVRGADLAECRKKYYKQKESESDFISKVKYDFHKASDLEVGDYICVPFSKKVKVPEDISEDKDFAWLMGWYLAEGSVSRRHDKPGFPFDKVILTLGGHEGTQAEKIKKIVEEKYHHSVGVEEVGGAIRLTISWKEYVNACIKHLGRGTRQSSKKFISQDVLEMPLVWQKSFLSAYLDGDGSQVKKRGRYYGAIRSSTASKQVASALCKLSARIGHRATFFKCSQHDTAMAEGNVIYENSYAKDISEFLGDRFFVHSSPQRFSCYIDSERGYILYPIKSIDIERYEGSVYNLHVENDNSYCVHSVAVHNCNVNGDYFPEAALAYPGPEYGFKTFELYAKAYQHHVNKDPKAAYGDVILSVYNPILHRVELIVSLDNKKAPDIVKNIEMGLYPDWSMGCKVPFDICSNCGNKAPKREYYCDCLKYWMAKIHPDTGKQCYAINTIPRFFDISRVIIGADRIAKTLMKVASGQGQRIFIMGSADLAAQVAGVDKRASDKRATIIKDIPTDTPPSSESEIANLVEAIPEVKVREKPLPEEVLDELGEAPFPQAMSTLAMLGILPKPQEFQRIVLISMGKRQFADELRDRNQCFHPMMVDDASPQHMSLMDINPDRFSGDLFRTLRPHIDERSYASPILGKRMTVIIKRAEQEILPNFIKTSADVGKKFSNKAFEEAGADKRTPVGPIPLLALAAGLYHAFSRKAPLEAAKGIDKVILKHPGLLAALGAAAVTTFNTMGGANKRGQFGTEAINPDANNLLERIEYYREKPILKVASPFGGIRAAGKRLFLGVPMAYAASSLLQKHKELRPYDSEGSVRRFVRRYPDVVSGALIVDALLSAKGKGTYGLARKAKSLWTSAKGSMPRLQKFGSALEDLGVSTPIEKTASVQDWMSSGLIWPLALGTRNLPGRIVGGLFDQAILDYGSKLLKRGHRKTYQ